MKARVLVIDDDQNHREGLVLLLQAHNYKVDQADGANPAMQLIQKNAYDLVITDFKMKEIDGMELLKMINDYDPLLKVIMVTGYSSIEHAVQAVHLGAVDYIPKPVDPAKLKIIIERILKAPVISKKINVPEKYVHFDDLVGKSRGIKNVIKKVHEIADIDVPVLIFGESGTGKELLPRLFTKPLYVKINLL